jgi:peptide-methionine (S)-S-oxide reductase
VNDLRSLFERLPIGWSVVVHDGRRYGVTRTIHGNGHSQSVYAEALDGSDVVSANLYDVGEGVLRPCEMPVKKVLDFLGGLGPDTS